MNAHTRIMPVAAPNLLSTRAAIVSLKISQWDGRCLDRKITNEINAAKNADADAIRANKKLLPKEALEGISSLAGKTRDEFNTRTLPWIDKGAGRIIAIEAHMSLCRWLGVQKVLFEGEVSKFLAQYGSYITDAPKRLGDAFDIADYPTPDEISKKFSMEIITLPVPTAADFRANISEAQADQIRTQIEDRVAAATHGAVTDVFERIEKVVGRMVERLNSYKPSAGRGDKATGIFRASLVDNIRDLVDIMPALNITADPRLDEMVRKLRPLTQHDAAALRDSPALRRDVAREAQQILDSVSGILA
ncbi:hypothetical protein GA830_10495 [Mesorhizobium sp. NBSH29]|uniref:hypothetical protein n=1 Tax=Mesorhizobium sp. NBSH29 TaxID=2654249 RepID=UPI00189663B0|nr:hypothetical protein [Mesorhizobium sp. NBSH29]QPC87123.1 hypothetical protein GA830_10495 [Mesorhizobium sp. NBSH29]